ncbi:RICIN domain-containing protein [Saccharothrix mutabilis subsp. mutabilis]|uniref:RICIN domain-containing protein n=1 Tax=Saccharothrix mutabilis subsp. mutabilis TaxID=66855 RepID=A0ABP3E1J4_9PSEU
MAATVLLATLATSGAATATSPAAGGVTSDGRGVEAAAAGPYQIRFEHSGKCVDNYKGWAAIGNKIQQWTCARPGEPNFNNQRWTFEWTSGGWAKIRNVGTGTTGHPSGWCLDISYNTGGNGDLIELAPCDSSVEWYGTMLPSPHPRSPDWYQLHPRTLSMCADMPHSSQVNGTQLQQWQCVLGNHQQHLTWS